MNAKELLISYGCRVGGYIPVADAPADKSRMRDIPESAFVVPFSVPYYSGKKTNLTVFSAARDYHVYATVISSALSGYFSEKYPGRYARVFADVSPFKETYLAAEGGLGVLGDHGMIIDPEYSAFVFLGEAVMELGQDELLCEGFSPAAGEVRYCEHCGKCRKSCPVDAFEDKSRCLSALSQKKGELSGEEAELIRKYGAVWGCDRCALSCPHVSMKESPVGYFTEDRLGVITDEDILRMSEDEYKSFSFSWRKREVILRNLRLCGFCAENTEDEVRK